MAVATVTTASTTPQMMTRAPAFRFALVKAGLGGGAGGPNFHPVCGVSSGTLTSSRGCLVNGPRPILTPGRPMCDKEIEAKRWRRRRRRGPHSLPSLDLTTERRARRRAGVRRERRLLHALERRGPGFGPAGLLECRLRVHRRGIRNQGELGRRPRFECQQEPIEAGRSRRAGLPSGGAGGEPTARLELA